MTGSAGVHNARVKQRPPTHPAVLASSMVVAILGVCGIVLLILGEHHDLATALVGLAVVTCWIPAVLRRKLDT